MSALAIAAVLAAGAAQPPLDLRVSAGLDWSSGTYGHTETTTVMTRSLALDLGMGAWAVRLSGAHVGIDGPASLVPVDLSAGPRAGRRGETAGEDRREGLADAVVAARWTPAPVERPYWYSLGVGATLPVGDAEAGLGRGDSDYFAHADFGYGTGPVSVAASVGYRITADPAWGDPASYAISVSRRIGGRGVVGAGLDGAQPPAPGFGAQAAASLFAGGDLGRLARLDLHLWRGLNEASGGFGGGMTLRRAFGGGR